MTTTPLNAAASSFIDDKTFETLIATRRATPRKRGRGPGESGVAGSALVAALLGAQVAEEAAAAGTRRDDDEDLSWLKTVRICGSHLASEAQTHATHVGVSSSIETESNSSVGAVDHREHFDSGGARLAEVEVRGFDKLGAEFRPARGGRKNFNDDLDDDGVIDTRDGGHAGGHTPVGATDPVSEEPLTGDDGHVHEDTVGGGADTVAGGATGGDDHVHDSGSTVPHPDDPAKQKEHIAVMNLVPVSGATHVAVSNGSWFDPKTWANGEVPGEGAKVLIPQGVVVDYDGKSAASIFTVRVDGELDFATDVDTFMEVDTFVVSPTGTLTIGTEGNPVDPSVSAVISFADNGPIDVAWDPMLLSRGLISHGTVDIHGAEKEAFLRVAVDPMKGDTKLTLESPPDGWQVGDKIVLAGTHLVAEKSSGSGTPITSQTQDEELVITAINGNVVTFDKPLQYNHEGARADLKTYVANYSRNVVFENEGGATTPVHERGHVMLMHSDNITVKYAEFEELGRTDKSIRSFDIGSLTTVSSDSNVRGRYSLHIHRAGTGDQEHPAIIEGNAVWGSPGWGFVHHDSNALFSNNAAYDVFGAAFVAETGNEIGRWDHNISIKSLGVDNMTKNGADVSSFDLGRTGTGFWFQSRLVEAVGNVAAGVPSGAGFTYFHRGPDSSMINIDPSNLGLADAFRYLSSVTPNTPSLAIFLNNETLASQTGLEIIKENPRQDHDLRSVIDNFLAWEVAKGVDLAYTGHYTIRNLDAVATDSLGTIKWSAGIELGTNVLDVVVNGANLEGFYTGVRATKVLANGFSGANEPWDYVYIDVSIKGSTVAYLNKTPGDKFLTAADLHDGTLLFNPATAGFLKQVNGVFDLGGFKTDSIGETAAYKPWDPDYVTTAELKGSMAQNGYWTLPDGRKIALIEDFVSDRATGDLIKVGVFVEVPSKINVVGTNNGVLNLNSKAPTAVDDVAHVQQGKSVVIDLIANDSDPDGDKIHLDGVFSQSGHVVVNDNGTVTYFADPNFKGDDVFYYWVQDSNGDITKAQVTVTVDI
jgi:hypothetical protein